MATIKQQRVFKEIIDNGGNVSKAMKAVGYSKVSAKNPQKVINSKNFQLFLATIDDTLIVDKWRKWALSEKDKRVSLEAGKEVLKLKDRYPATKIKAQAYTDELEQLKESENIE